MYANMIAFHSKPLLLLINFEIYFYLKKNLIDVFFHEIIKTLDLTTMKIITEITFLLCKFHLEKQGLAHEKCYSSCILNDESSLELHL